MLPEISARDLAGKLKGPQPPLVVDVRDPHEYAYCRIEGAQLKPLGQIRAWAKELDPGAEIILLCHSGYRSAQATLYLRNLGFKNVHNLRGGIDAWSVDVDPSVPRY
jgi:rhodanese-related sulfurtransferase